MAEVQTIRTIVYSNSMVMKVWAYVHMDLLFDHDRI